LRSKNLEHWSSRPNGALGYCVNWSSFTPSKTIACALQPRYAAFGAIYLAGVFPCLKHAHNKRMPRILESTNLPVLSVAKYTCRARLATFSPRMAAGRTVAKRLINGRWDYAG
jgi:hypothetical protein